MLKFKLYCFNFILIKPYLIYIKKFFNIYFFYYKSKPKYFFFLSFLQNREVFNFFVFTKKKKISFIRSPHVFKKSKERFLWILYKINGYLNLVFKIHFFFFRLVITKIFRIFLFWFPSYLSWKFKLSFFKLIQI